MLLCILLYSLLYYYLYYIITVVNNFFMLQNNIDLKKIKFDRFSILYFEYTTFSDHLTFGNHNRRIAW